MRPAAEKFVLLFLLVWITGVACAEKPEIQISTGELDGALYTVAKPQHWQGQLLLIAHGYRPEDFSLSAEIDTRARLYSGLLETGWMVAKTSYRRNGIIINDAITDLENLLRHIEITFSKPTRTLLMGDSMGGAIGVLIAENQPDKYDGILAVGAALHARDFSPTPTLSHDPKIPLLFLSNQDETEQPAEYVRLSAQAVTPPALWTVKRDGHVNVNDDERAAALLALNQFVDGGQIARGKDGTIASSYKQSTAIFEDGRSSGHITEVTDGFGNFFTSFVKDDLDRLGIKRETRFGLTVGDHNLRVFWGATYGDVAPGEWVAFISSDGRLMVARNRQNACKTVNCRAGDTLFMSP